MEHIQQAMELKAELDTLRPLSAENEARIMQKFRLDWDYHSNHLEGNSLSYGETKSLIINGLTAQGKPLKDHIEISGHDEAVKYVIDFAKSDEPLTEKTIRELHIMVLQAPYKKPAITTDGERTFKWIEIGKYKQQPNHVKTITEEIFYFATPEETPALMQELMNWYRDKKEAANTNPILFAAEFHHKFITIHPFDDGNGRVCRLLMNLILLQSGYTPAIIKSDKEQKAKYYSFLQSADAGNIEPFIEFIAKNVMHSLDIMITGAKGGSIEEPNDLDKEIALLEHRLSKIGKKATITKTEKSILNIYNNSIERLIRHFIEASKKFDKFYVENSMVFLVNNAGSAFSDLDQVLFLIKNRITPHTSNITIDYSYQGFKQIGLGEFNFPSTLEIRFALTIYSMKIFKDNTVIEKHYDDQLTDNEIDRIVKSETKRHLEFINTKMKDFENKQV